MKETDQLEPQQYQRLYWEADVPVRDLRARLMKRLLYLAIVLFVVIFVVAGFVRFPDQIELPFSLKNNIKEEVYKFPHAVYLLHEYIKNSDSVQVGSPLIRITSPEIAQLINRYAETEHALENLNSSGRKAEMSQRDMLMTHIRQNQNLIADYKHQLELDKTHWREQKIKLEAELRETQDKLSATRNLRSQSIGSKFDSIEQETKLAQIKSSLNQEDLKFEKENVRLVNLIERLTLENEMTQSRLQKTTAEFVEDSMALVHQKILAWNKIKDSYGDFNIEEGAIVLKSPIQGMIHFLFEGEKEIPEGVTALKISNKQQAFYAFAKCPPSLAGKLEENQACHLKVFSFPFYEYGAMQGNLRSFSYSADEKGDYNLRIDIVDPGRLAGLLQPGLTGNAVIIIEEKTLLEYFFNKVKKHYRQILDGENL
ncbi:MAG: hypothetical protein IPM48_09125 [Saprospiraceae bacterium]|nr:hypothetical protein [Saprospiraceae bacterium]